ncbi:MAG: multicopper oxidase domain-containing protein [Micromonosporaceae bacterium]|nr:multicopper oxidase domain-containing protein [Micromonosporaceae bacterium]
MLTDHRHPVHRRTLLRAGLVAGGAGLLAACGRDDPQPTAGFVTPDGEEVRAAEAARNPGRVREVRRSAVAGPVDLGGLTVSTWSYDGRVPGAPIRVAAGEVVRATVANQLPEATSIHWHGIALRNDGDGVPGVTQPRSKPGLSTSTSSPRRTCAASDCGVMYLDTSRSGSHTWCSRIAGVATAPGSCPGSGHVGSDGVDLAAPAAWERGGGWGGPVRRREPGAVLLLGGLVARRRLAAVDRPR